MSDGCPGTKAGAPPRFKGCLDAARTPRPSGCRFRVDLVGVVVANPTTNQPSLGSGMI